LLSRAFVAAGRIEAGIDLLKDAQVLEAFHIANRAMAIAIRRRFGVMQSIPPASVTAPAWHPFQLAFILMNLKGIVEPSHDDRDVVDLLFFPDRRRQDRSVPRPGRVHARLPAVAKPRHRVGGPQRAYALHAATAHPRPTRPGRHAHLRFSPTSAVGTKY
jgi:hypothetical protein